MRRELCWGLLLILAAPSLASARTTSICVAVTIKKMEQKPKPSPQVKATHRGTPPRAKKPLVDPSMTVIRIGPKLSAPSAPRYPYPPAKYLQRLIEHYVTHERGYQSVSRGCTERITIELYPLKQGWTAFGRYTRTKQEEKVDKVTYDEFPRFAERVVLALLYNKHIDKTANLKNILRADSFREYRTIKGQHHFTFDLGSSFLLGKLPTTVQDGTSDSFRLLTPMTFSLGYRGRFNAWGIASFIRGGVGLSKRSAASNPQGGHVDLAGLFGVGINFLRYQSPHGMISFYYGGGATFNLSMFSMVRAEDQRKDDDRDLITLGGLNLNGVLGFEFMRASSVQFFVQFTVSLPVYVFNKESQFSTISSWMPELSAQVGIMF